MTRSALLLLLCFLLAGCVESDFPLSDFAPLAPDHPLLGSWVAKDGEQSAYLHIGNQEDGLKLLEVEIDDKGKLKSETYVAHASAVAGKEYLNVRFAHEGTTVYYLLKFSLAGKDTLHLWLPDYDFMAEAVKKGMIAGSVQSGKWVPKVQLSASQADLQKFVADNDARIYPKPSSTLQRLPRGEAQQRASSGKSG